jgi:hypothetical protein
VVSPPLQNISHLGWLFPIYGKNVPNHQPVYFQEYFVEDISSERFYRGTDIPCYILIFNLI